MAFNKANYIVVWDSSPQVYSMRTLENLFKSNLPEGVKPEDNKSVMFASFFPESGELKVFTLSEDEIEKRRVEWLENEKLVEERREARKRRKSDE